MVSPSAPLWCWVSAPMPLASVTSLVKEAAGEAATVSDTDRLPIIAATSTGPGGHEWGSAVHGVLLKPLPYRGADRLAAALLCSARRQGRPLRIRR